MKKFILAAAILCSGISIAQENGTFFGGFESNSQWLLNDTGINFDAPNDPFSPEDTFRANNYFQLNYNYDKFTVGAQYESYLPSAILGFAPDFYGQNGIATYYLNYKDEILDVTGGYFYEQFGSGLILRSWEDRQLGINNALHGVRVKFSPLDYLDITAVYGQQRVGFELSDGTIQGADVNANVSQALNIENVDIRMGASYVARFQNTGSNDTIPSLSLIHI